MTKNRKRRPRDNLRLNGSKVLDPTAYEAIRRADSDQKKRPARTAIPTSQDQSNRSYCTTRTDNYQTR